jgi:hypothetical protein
VEKLVHITLKQIEALQPCDSQMRDVRQFFGARKRVRVTVAAAVAVAQRFNFEWLAETTLRGGGRRSFKAFTKGAFAAHYNTALPAWRAFAAVKASADTDYYQAPGGAAYSKSEGEDPDAVYHRAAAYAVQKTRIGAAWNAYECAIAAADRALKEDIAAAWARAYINQEQSR